MDGTDTRKSASTDTLTDHVRDWYEHSPTAKRAYTRLRADIDTVMAQARPRIDEFWRQIGPMIDPPAKEPGASDQQHNQEGQNSSANAAGTSGSRQS